MHCLPLRGTALIVVGVAATCFGQTRKPNASSPLADSVAEAMRDDAQLYDVTFVDRNHGWAVGDRGVIWNTSDGGTNWQPQKSGVQCPLRSVQFLDKLNGWAAGGWTDPWLHTSRGVVLRTRDGGRSWRPTADVLLPAVRRIKFFSLPFTLRTSVCGRSGRLFRRHLRRHPHEQDQSES